MYTASSGAQTMGYTTAVLAGAVLFALGCDDEAGHGVVNEPVPDVVARTLGPGVADAATRGVAALLERQHEDGSWGGDEVKVQNSHKSDYPVAIGSLAYLALETVAPGDPNATRAKRKGLRFILDTIHGGNMRNTRDNTPKVHERNVWSQGFSMLALSRILRAGDVASGLQAEVRNDIADMVSALGKSQQKDGGWTYDRGPSESFLTSTVLIGLVAARDAGIAVPQRLIVRPISFLAHQSNPGNYVPYQGIPRRPDTSGKVRDSTGRSVLLELALLRAGAGSRKKLAAAVETFFKYRKRLDRVRDLEAGCHQPPYRIGTFYCFYSYFYVAWALEYLGGGMRDTFRPILRDHFISLQKTDGYWIDSRDHCGESYGTAMGLLVLSAPVWVQPQ